MNDHPRFTLPTSAITLCGDTKAEALAAINDVKAIMALHDNEFIREALGESIAALETIAENVEDYE